MYDKCRLSKNKDGLCARSSGVYCGKGLTLKTKGTRLTTFINKIKELPYCPKKDNHERA